MRKFILAAALVLAADPARASDAPTGAAVPSARESIEETGRAAAMKSWKISIAPLLASQALDAASSYGMRELNPLLASANGGFEMKAASIKLGVTTALVGIEYLIVRKYPRSTRVISKLNWTSGIVTTGFAVHNFAIR